MNNQLTAVALDNFFGKLHSNTIEGDSKTIYIGENPGADACNKDIAINRGWQVNLNY